MKLLQLNTLPEICVAEIKPFFDNLPETSHKDGKYRLRRYSVVEVRTTFWDATREAEISRKPTRSFKQSRELNSHQGGMSRLFKEIEEDALQSEYMKEALLVFKQANDMSDGQEVEIHQMRVRTLSDKTWTHVSPEGIHQDGFDHIAMLGVNRYNIHGGGLMAYKEKEGYGPFVTHALEDGEILMLSDRELWHNATPIARQNEDEVGYGDWFVFCANK